MTPDVVDRTLAVRAVAVYLPVVAVALVAIVRRPGRRTITAAFVATMWHVPALLAVNQVAIGAGWWTFTAEGATVAGVPVECWLGWAVLWGAVPILLGGASSRPRACATVALAVAVDLVAMPAMAPVVVLGDGWLLGEVVAVVVGLAPALVLGRWTEDRTHVCGRAALQAVVFAGTTLFVVPALVLEATGGSWAPLPARGRTKLVVAGVLVAPFAAVALQAVRELAMRGGGTPFPYDPPDRLVTTGPYAYVANPMQLGASVLLAAEGVLLSSTAVVAAAAGAAVFSAGFAAWHEHLELAERFGNRWVAYRRSVRPWWPRRHPYLDTTVEGVAVVYAASTCEPCDEVRGFLADRRRHGLDVVPAERATTRLRRITYVGADGHTEDGLAGIARALEHVHLGWAVGSAIVRLPGVLAFLQVINDAVGAGPRDPSPPEDLSELAVPGHRIDDQVPQVREEHGAEVRRADSGVSPRSPGTPACAAGGGSRTSPTG